MSTEYANYEQSLDVLRTDYTQQDNYEAIQASQARTSVIGDGTALVQILTNSSPNLVVGAPSGGYQTIDFATSPDFVSFQIGTEAEVTKAKIFSGAIDFASTAAGSTDDKTLTATGAAVGDFVIPIMPVPATGCIYQCLGVTAADTITFRHLNASAAPVDPASATFSVLLIRAV